jgi:hypothetical protein
MRTAKLSRVPGHAQRQLGRPKHVPLDKARSSWQDAPIQAKGSVIHGMIVSLPVQATRLPKALCGSAVLRYTDKEQEVAIRGSHYRLVVCQEKSSLKPATPCKKARYCIQTLTSRTLEIYPNLDKSTANKHSSNNEDAAIGLRLVDLSINVYDQTRRTGFRDVHRDATLRPQQHCGRRSLTLYKRGGVKNENGRGGLGDTFRISLLDL